MSTTVKVMTWNVENLFRPPLNASDELKQLYLAKLLLIANVIRNVSPDIVALQEIGSTAALDDLSSEVGAPYVHAIASGFPDSRGIRVAFLASLPISEQIDIVDFLEGPASLIAGLGPGLTATAETHMGRGALAVVMRKGGMSIRCLTLHLKSKLLSYPSEGAPRFSPVSEAERTHAAGVALHRRTAEAVTLRLHANMLLESEPSTALVVLGDFNDVPGAATTQIFQGPEGSEIGTRGFDAPDQHDEVRLFNTSALISEPRRYSRVHRGTGELLDQIFASALLFPRESSGRRRLPVVDSLVDFHSALPSITNDPILRAKEIAPDHAPVMATFSI